MPRQCKIVHFYAMRKCLCCTVDYIYIYYIHTLYTLLCAAAVIIIITIIQCTRAGDFLLSLMVRCCTMRRCFNRLQGWLQLYMCATCPLLSHYCRVVASTGMDKLICCAFSRFFPPYKSYLLHWLSLTQSAETFEIILSQSPYMCIKALAHTRNDALVLLFYNHNSSKNLGAALLKFRSFFSI